MDSLHLFLVIIFSNLHTRPEIDSISHMPIWKNDQGTSGDAMVEEPESSSANVSGVPDIVSHLIREEVPVNARK